MTLKTVLKSLKPQKIQNKYGVFKSFPLKLLQH